jgi:hypothetical protein
MKKHLLDFGMVIVYNPYQDSEQRSRKAKMMTVQPENPMFTLTVANLRGILLEVRNPNDMTVMDLIYELRQLSEGVDITETSALRGIEILNTMHKEGITV